MEKKEYFGWDCGFGNTKSAFVNKKTKGIELVKFPSVVALSDGEEKHTYLLDDGKYYFVGEKALKQKKENIIEILDYQKLEKFAPILLLESFKLCNLNPDELNTIVTGLSISHTEEAKKFKSRLSKFKVNNKEYKFSISLLPQGLGAVNAIRNLVENGEPEDYMVVDNGFNTLDIVVIKDKEVIRSELKGFENKGIINIAEMVKIYIKNNYNRDISIKMAIKLLDKKEYFLRGEKYDLSEEIKIFKTEYTEELMNFLEKNYSEYIDNMEKIVFVGGGSYFIDTNYAKNIVTVDNAEFYNAYGNLLTKIKKI